MLSVIVPATDSPASLERCIEAIRGSMPADSELLVQADPEGAGPASARNLAADRARGDVLVFVDADVIVESRALAAIAARFERDPGLTALFGAYDDAPAAPGAVSRFRNLLHHRVHVASAGPVESFWAGLGAVRREAFAATGGFDDERYPEPAIEDIELGCRLADRGARIELDPTIRGKHLKAWTLRSMVATDLRSRGAPWTRLQLERRRVARGLNLSPAQIAGTAAAAGAVLAGAKRRPRAAVGFTLGMAATNAPLYRLLVRNGGARLAAAGVPLQAVHHLTAAASVPVGALGYVVARRREGSS